MRAHGISRIAGAVAGLLIWAAHFGAIYGINAILCARRLAGTQLLGLPVAPVLVTAATLLALLGIAIVLARALRRLPHGLLGEEQPQFMPWLAATTALLAGLAIAFEGVPALILPACG